VGVVAVIGEHVRVQGFALAGALTLDAETAESVRTAWRTLPSEVVMVVLTPSAAEALGGEFDDAPSRPFTVVMPS
jgi:vacuolar-type H+-ATPase subunit F/Vma7